VLKNTLKHIRNNMKLIVKDGSYEADTLWGIIVAVLSHRFWHLRTHGKWMD
jgi:hypothetical protein